MADESVVIEVRDGVEKTIARNLSEISSQARGAYQNVEKLVRQLNRVKPTAIAQFNSVVTNAQRQMSQAAISAQRLATEQQRTAQASTNAATAEQRLAQASARAEAAQAAAAGAALRLENARTKAAAAADRQAAAEQRAAAAAAAQARQLRLNNAELTRINGVHDRFDAVLARNPKYSRAFTKGIKEAGVAAKLTRHELNNLAFQANDIAVGFASGQRPLTIFMQQGSQIGQIFGTSGVGLGAIFKQLAGIVGRLLARLAPFAAIAGAILAPFSLFTRELNKGIDGNKLVADLKLTEDQMKRLKESGEEFGITFGDTFKATFQVIGRYASQFFKPVTDNIVKWWNAALDWLTKALSIATRALLGLFIGMGNAVKVVFNNIPASIELAFKTAANSAIATVENMINLISRAVLGSPLGKLLGIESAPEIKLPRLELSDAAKDVSTQLAGAFDDGFKRADELVDKFSGDVRAQALANAQNRLRNAAGEADPTNKRGFNRAKELAEINAQLDSQAKHMFTLATARDAANRAEEIALRFAKEGQPLTQAEISALRSKIQALNDAKEIQQQFDRIYQSATGPQREYNATLAAADKLLKMGVISQEKYNAELARAHDALKSATDPLYKMNKELDEQIKLLGMLGPKREIEQQVMQAINAAIAAGQPLREKEIADLREKLQLVQQLNNQAAITDQLQANSLAQQSRNRQDRTTAAIGQIGVNGFSGLDAVSQLSQDNPALQATEEYKTSVMATYQDMFAQIEQLRQADVISEQSAMIARSQLWVEMNKMRLQNTVDFFGNLSALSNSSNKKLAAIGKAAALTQATIKGYLAIQEALASPPGWPYNAANVVAVTAMQASNVAAIASQPAGFQTGGEFTVGGRGAADSQLVQFRGTPGERVRIDTPRQVRKGDAREEKPQVVQPKLNLVVVSDPSLVGQYLDTAEGEEALVVTLDRNGYRRN